MSNAEMDFEASILADVPTIRGARKKKAKALKSLWTYEETMGLINLMGAESGRRLGPLGNINCTCLYPVWGKVLAELQS